MSISQREGVLFSWKTESPDRLQWYHTGAFFTQLTSDPRAHPWCGSLVPPAVCEWKLPCAGSHRKEPRKCQSVHHVFTEHWIQDLELDPVLQAPECTGSHYSV